MVHVEVYFLDDDDADADYGFDNESLHDAALDLLEWERFNVGDEEPIAVAADKFQTVHGVLTMKPLENEGYSFSVIVSSGSRRKGIARDLVEAMIEYMPDTYFQAWVVNPHMGALLESLGFDSDSRGWSQDTPHMEMWT